MQRLIIRRGAGPSSRGSFRWRVFSDELIRRAHGLGIRVVVWTVDDADTMHRLLDAGVDGLITDRPDRLREVLISREQWNAPRAMDQTL